MQSGADPLDGSAVTTAKPWRTTPSPKAKMADDSVGLAGVDTTAATGSANQFLQRTSNGITWATPTGSGGGGGGGGLRVGDYQSAGYSD